MLKPVVRSLLTLAALLTGNVQAETVTPTPYSIGVEAFVGHSDFSGDLRGQGLSAGFGERLWFNGADSHGGFLGFDVKTGAFKKHGDAFPFPRGENMRFTTYSLTLNTCKELAIPVDACFGVGLAMLSMEAKENGQWYGAPTVSAQLLHVFKNGIFASASAQGLPMREVVDGKRAAFTAATFAAGVGMIMFGNGS